MSWPVVGPRLEPGGAIDLFPTIRQSLLSKKDDCDLSMLFEMRYRRGWSTSPAAAGTIFHRVAAECLREMIRNDSKEIPVGVALAILEETLRQRDVEPEEIARVPLRDLPLLEMAVKKFARDNEFSVRNIIEVERKLAWPIYYEGRDGKKVERILTGTPDALIAVPPDEAAILDWKNTWSLPPDRSPDAEDPGISYHGYFQQMFYGWLVMKNYPSVDAVTLREFYVRRTKVRKGRITRADLEKIELRLSVLVESFDRAVEAGAPPRLDLESLEAHGYWKPSPGKHCSYCPGARLCPIEDEAGVTPPRTPEAAAELAGFRSIAKAVHKQADTVLQPYVDLNGPIPIKNAKGRRVLGYRQLRNGDTRWAEFTPEGSDRPPDREAYNPNLEGAMAEATERAKASRQTKRQSPGGSS